MITISHPDKILRGKIRLPASKSISNRALIIRAVSGHFFQISNLSQATDTTILERLITSDPYELNCGDGGTTMRFLLSLLVLREKECIVNGSDQLQKRPVKPLVDALNSLGASIEYVNKNDCLPLKINSSVLKGGKLQMDASISSQFTSALMMIAPYLPGGLEIQLSGKIASHSYIKMTAALMFKFGVEVQISDHSVLIPQSEYKPVDIFIEPDWSAASYWLEAAALSIRSDFVLENLSVKSFQGDAIALELIHHFGVRCKEVENGIRVVKNSELINKNFEHDFSDNPDLVPAFAILCAAKGINGRLSGLETLRWKESDRIQALQILIGIIGCKSEYSKGSLEIIPGTISEPSSPLPVFNDHRMAMCLAPLSLVLSEIIIKDPGVVSKSYPGIWEELSKTGFRVV
ncbi:MAG: 3-phosphoshikimate 1-carboxyvinyltransferase [Bacteroidota bacterium]